MNNDTSSTPVSDNITNAVTLATVILNFFITLWQSFKMNHFNSSCCWGCCLCEDDTERVIQTSSITEPNTVT